MKFENPDSKNKIFTRRRVLIIAAVVLIIAAAVLLIVSRPEEKAVTDNLLKNGDFTLLDDAGIPEDWYTDAWNDGAGVTEFSTDEVDGVNCFCIRNRFENDARLAQYVEVEPDSYYCLEGYIWAEADGGWGANFSIENVLQCSERVYSTGDSWRKVTYWGKTSPDQTYVTVFLRLGGYSAESAGYVWFSNVSLVRYEELPDGVFADEWFVRGEDEYVKEEETGKSATALSSSVLILMSALLYIIIADILLVWARREKKHPERRFPVTEYIAVFFALVAAVVIRILAATRVRGYDIDVNDFVSWARDIKELGASGFYTNISFCDYPPGYMLVLRLTALFGEPSALGIKMPSVLCDLLLATVIIIAGIRYTTTRKAMVMGLLYLLCPVTICTGAAWGQSDAVMALFLGISVVFALRHQWAFALPAYTVAVLMKPQALMFGPLGVAALILDIILTAAAHKKETAVSEKKDTYSLKRCLIRACIGCAASAVILGIVVLLFTDFAAVKNGIGIYASEQDPEGPVKVAYTFECDSVSVTIYDSESDMSGETDAEAQVRREDIQNREKETEHILSTTAVYCYTDGSVSMMNRGEIIRSGSWTAENGVLYLNLDERDYQISDIRKDKNDPYIYDQYVKEKIPYSSCYTFSPFISSGEMGCWFSFSCRGQSADWLVRLYRRTLSSYDFCTVNGCNLAFLAGENWQDAGTTPVSPLVMFLSRLAFVLPLILCCFGRKKDRRKGLLYLAVTLTVLGEALLYLFLKNANSIMASDWGTAVIVLSVVFTLWLLLQGKDLKHLPLTAAVLLLLLFNTGTKMHERYLFPALMLLVIAFLTEKDRRIIWLLLGVTAFSLMNVGCVLDRNLRIGGADGHLSAPAFGLESDTAFLEYMSAAGNYLCTLLGVWITADLCFMKSSPWELKEIRSAVARDTLYAAVTGRNGSAGSLKEDDKEKVTGRTGRMSGKDRLIVGVVTVLYAVLALTNLGSMKAPQTEYTYRDSAVFDLGEHHDFTLKMYIAPEYVSGRIAVYAGEDRDDLCQCMDKSVSSMDGAGWKTLSDPSFSGRYLKLDFSRCYSADIGEVLCYDNETGAQIPLTLVNGFETHKALCDEQQVLDMPAGGLLAQTLASRNEAFLPVPETYYAPGTDENTLVFDLGEHRDFKLLFYSGIQWQEVYSCELKVSDTPDGDGSSYGFESQDGDCFAWKYVYDRNEIMSGRYVTLYMSECVDMSLFEILCRDAVTDEPVPLTLVSGPEEAAALCDEPDSLEGEPSWWNSTYFDEIYHARTAYEHLHGLRVYETTHPPLGKVIMSWSVGIFGMCPFGWRLPGALCGVFMLPAIYMIARLLMKKRRWAVGAILLLAFDCMHFTQTRIATIDSFVVLFILWSVYFMFYWMKQDYFGTKYRKTLLPLLASGVCMGLSVASKWTGCYNGIGLAILFFFTWIYRLMQVIKARRMVRKEDFADCNREQVQRITGIARGGYLKLFGTLVSCIVFFIVIPLLIYYLSYIPYFAYDGGITVEKVIEAAVGKYFITGEVGGMLGYHGTPGLGMDHYFYSPWYEWPIDAKPMWFYSGSYSYDSAVGSTIMTMGNPAVWWGGLLAMLVMIVMIYVYCRYRWSRRGSLIPAALRDHHGMQWLLVVFTAQFLPWTLVPRGTYIYHYFACVPVIILASMCVLSTLEQLFESRRAVRAEVSGEAPGDDMTGDIPAGRKSNRPDGLRKMRSLIFPGILIAYIVICLVLFIAFFPYASGIEVSKNWLEGMKWFNNWLWY